MKKLFILLVIICGITLSCTDSSFDNIPENISFELDRENVTITSDGGSVEVLVYSNYKWKISGACDWCSPSLANGKANEDGTEVVFHVKANGSFDSREAVFCFQCGDKSIEFIICQASNDVLTSSHSTNLDVSGFGETVAIQYIATQDCDVIIPDDAMSWISIDPATRGLEKHSTMLNIMANNTRKTRKATIKVVFRDNAEIFVEYTITQISKNYCIQYTSADGEKIYTLQLGDSQEVNNTYKNGVGVIEFNNPVTEIDDDAFEFCNNLTSISLPNSVTYIGRDAFRGCTNLSNITFEEGVKTIGDYAFSGCTSLTSVTIPDSVTSIGDSAFYNCTSLTSVAIPDSVTSIGDSAFSGCTSLTSITIPDSVTSIGDTAFYNCTSLTSIAVPNSVTEIGDNAFAYCNSLREFTFGEGVKTVGANIFEGCGNLTKVYISDIATWCGISFVDSIFTEGRQLYLNNELIKDIVIPDTDIVRIGDNVFCNCKSLTSVTIPNDFISIGISSFEGCSSLTNITVPDSVKSIGYRAFAGCNKLECLTIGKGVSEIGGAAFRECTGKLVVNCSIPNGYDGYGGVYGTHNKGVFAGSQFTNVIIGDGSKMIGDYAFSWCNSIQSIVIDADITRIGDGAFWSCENLTRVNIPNSVISIGATAFSECGSLTDITIPDSVISIGAVAFSGCGNLTDITIPDSVTAIGGGAFRGCVGLESLTIGKNVKEIGRNVFYDCRGELFVNCNIPGTDYGNSWEEGIFYGSGFDKITFGDNVTSIGDYAFRFYYKSTPIIVIGKGVKEIGVDAFRECQGELIVNCSNIPKHAFELSSFSTVTINDSVITIGDYAFECCDMTSITIPFGVTKIGNRAFQNCTNLTTVTISDSVTSIGDYAFSGCDSLKDVYCKPTTPPMGGDWMFPPNNALYLGIYVPSNSVSAYKSASYWWDYKKHIFAYDFE